MGMAILMIMLGHLMIPGLTRPIENGGSQKANRTRSSSLLKSDGLEPTRYHHSIDNHIFSRGLPFNEARTKVMKIHPTLPQKDLGDISSTTYDSYIFNQNDARSNVTQQGNRENGVLVNEGITNHQLKNAMSSKLEQQKQTESTHVGKLVPFCPIFTFLSFLIFVSVVCCLKYKCNSQRLIVTTNNPAYISSRSNLEKKPKRTIKFVREIDEGQFGKIYEGLLKDNETKCEVRCAVKTLISGCEIDSLREAHLLNKLKTHQVMQFLGVVVQDERIHILMEFMVNSNLKTFLKDSRLLQYSDGGLLTEKNTIGIDRMLRMAVEIADGMAYISSKNIVHRDLAARNCLVAEDLMVKIGDFGMSRYVHGKESCYRITERGHLPIRWMAPESIAGGIFTSSSDMWSYGIVLWEIFSFGEIPYDGLTVNNIIAHITHGNLLKCPVICPTSVYKLMMQIWNQNQLERPNFFDIIRQLLKI